MSSVDTTIPELAVQYRIAQCRMLKRLRAAIIVEAAVMIDEWMTLLVRARRVYV